MSRPPRAEARSTAPHALPRRLPGAGSELRNPSPRRDAARDPGRRRRTRDGGVGPGLMQDPGPGTPDPGLTSTVPLFQFVRTLRPVERIPGLRALERGVDVVDVLDALGLEPLAERRGAFLGVDGNPVLPRRAAAEHARVAHAGFGGECE